MKKLFLFVFFTAYVYGAAAGEIVSAGFGREVALKGAHFEFEGKPGVPQRFYGCNLCFTANYLSDDEADALCARLASRRSFVVMGWNDAHVHGQYGARHVRRHILV